VGLGYVGLPLACTAAQKGFTVLGFDVDDAKVKQLQAGKSYIRHIDSADIASLQGAGKFSATKDFSRISEVDAILLCVPTPLTKQREPDLQFVVQTGEAIAPFLRAGQLVVLESTTYPGTTREVLLPILETSGFRCGRDFYLAYSPEREDPGNPRFNTATIPKVVGGDSQDAVRLARALYDEIVTHTVPVSSLDAAEAVKLTENIFRSVNIALVNELKVVFEAMGIDVWEVIEAAKSKPFGYMPFYPGPGLGGHCIPIDPFYLTWKAREFGLATRFIELAGEINTAMPSRVVDRVAEALSDRAGKAVRGAGILILGLAYKKNVEDTRESPAFKIIELLEKRGARVSFHDPFVAEIPLSREHPEYAGRQSVPFTEQVVSGFDATIVCTDHDNIDYAKLVEWAPLIIDTRNACLGRGLAGSRIVPA
jgi:UDP-N-acetyl-D-glucosamine dehydrogenase